MKKNLFFAAIALVALAGCTGDDFVGDQNLQKANENGAISFGFDVPAVTRASGEAAATALGSQFIVYGEKSETSDGATAAAGNLVFKNYMVNYTSNTAYTTTSNTKNWEYVGLKFDDTNKYADNISPNSGKDVVQTIKYWDYGASNYVFTAVSAKQADITAGDVKITKITEKTTDNKVYDKGYTVVLTAAADPTLLYFSDRQAISPTAGTDRNAVNAYGGNVTFTFRNATSQIRVGMYETIPGYVVKIKKFYYVDNTTPTFETMSTGVTSNFTANVPNLTTANGATLNVTYYHEGTRVNQPKIGVAGTAANYITFTGSGLTADVTLAETVASPTYDNSGTFTMVFPQETNDKNLKLKLDYDLYNNVSGEIIHVTGATAEIPAQYLQWKPNYKYTYLFKISPNTNGTTGQSIVGLYPITFDAVTVEAADGTAEYITTVSEPSITTFGVKSGKIVTGKADYETGTDIYATIVASSSVVDPTSKYKVYTATSSDANYPITEANVAEAIAEKAIGRVTTPVITSTEYTTNVSVVTSVPGEDGIAKTITGAIKMENVSSAGAYVISYKASDGSATATTEAYDASKTYYSVTADALGFYPIANTTAASDAASDWDSNKSKYTTAPTQPVYVYKVVTVTTAP